MKLSSLLLVSAFLSLTHQVSAQAALVAENDPFFGVGSITRDTETNLDWLDVSLSQGRSFLDVTNELGAGGDFAGFRHASIAEFQTLVLNAGIGNTNSVVTGDLSAFTNLINLVGTTEIQNGYPQTLGFLEEPRDFDTRVNGELDFFFQGSVPAYSATTTVLRSQSVDFNNVGHWLVRPSVVPEPLTILGSLTAVGLGWATKRKVQAKK
jgi:hypothetical protein